MVPGMSPVMAYAGVAGIVLLAGGFVLHRMDWPRAAWQQAALATLLALVWPLSVPAMAFGGVAVTALLRHTPQTESREAVAPVAPAGRSVTPRR